MDIVNPLVAEEGPLRAETTRSGFAVLLLTVTLTAVEQLLLVELSPLTEVRHAP